MKLQIVGYSTDTYKMIVLMEQIISPVANWERILRKMYNWVWKHNSNKLIDLFAVMDNEEGHHELSQAWAVEYNENYPGCELPFI